MTARILLGTGVLLLWSGWGGDSAMAREALQLVDDFNHDVQNALRGYCGVFQRAPSQASLLRVSDVARGAAGRSLRVRADRQPEGFCGVWMHLFDMRAAEPTYFDARAHRYLSFWVRGAHGGEDFVIKLADREWIIKEDSLPLGRVSQFLPGGVTTKWREVLVPLLPHPRLNPAMLGGVVLEFDVPGQQTVYIDDLCFKANPKAMAPQARLSRRPATSRRPRAMWVWSTERLVSDRDECAQLVKFCQSQNIGQLWMQLPYSREETVPSHPAETKSAAAKVRCVITLQEELRALLEQAHQGGIRIHALDGAPEFAQKEMHHIPLAVVDAVIEFNRRSPASQRFAGVHFDNEPYLLPGWRLPERRETILQEFLDLNAECQRRIREAPGLEFGVDIPFWWNATDPATGRPVAEVAYGGKRQAASLHCIDLLDNVGVMNYRDSADGADGMIAHGRQLLSYADQAGRAKVYMGVETYWEPPTPVWFVLGPTRAAWERALKQPDSPLANISRFHGFRIRLFDDGQHLHVGLEHSASPTPQVEEALAAAMVELAHHLAPLAAENSGVQTRSRQLQAQVALADDPELQHYRNKPIVDTATGKQYPGFTAESVMLSKITFADDTLQDLQEQLEAADAYFSESPSYAGIAIHFYETYRRKVDEASPRP